MDFARLKPMSEFRLEEDNTVYKKLDDHRAMSADGKIITLHPRDWCVPLKGKRNG